MSLYVTCARFTPKPPAQSTICILVLLSIAFCIICLFVLNGSLWDRERGEVPRFSFIRSRHHATTCIELPASGLSKGSLCLVEDKRDILPA